MFINNTKQVLSVQHASVIFDVMLIQCMSSTKSPVLKLVEEIIAADPGVRFASIIDKNGDVVEGIMNSGKTNLKSQQEEEYFCRQVAKRRKIRKEFDASLGKVLRTGGAGKTYQIVCILYYTIVLCRVYRRELVQRYPPCPAEPEFLCQVLVLRV